MSSLPESALSSLALRESSESESLGAAGQTRVPSEPIVLNMLIVRWKAGCSSVSASSSRFWVSSRDMPVCSPRSSAADAEAALRWWPEAAGCSAADDCRDSLASSAAWRVQRPSNDLACFPMLPRRASSLCLLWPCPLRRSARSCSVSSACLTWLAGASWESEEALPDCCGRLVRRQRRAAQLSPSLGRVWPRPARLLQISSQPKLKPL